MDNLENQIPENEITEETEKVEETICCAEETAEACVEADVSAQVEEEQAATEETEEEQIPVKKASPYADGPYEVNFEEPVKKVKDKKPRAKRSHRKGWIAVLCGVLAVLLLGGGCFATAYAVNNHWEEKMEDLRWEVEAMIKDRPSNGFGDAGSNTNKPVQSVSGTMTPAQVYEENADTVVMVWCEVRQEQNGQIVTGTSTGSGFVVSEDGYVVTNAHVVNGATSVKVTIYNNTEYAAQIVGADSVNDVALLKIEASGLDYAAIGSSSDLIVGDQVVAIGNPLGELTSTLTVGYISAKERDVNSSGNTINMLQTDAAINSGNSGGPLFNMKGQVVGITTAKYSGTTESGAVIEGIGFAIPIDDVYDLLSDLMNYGYVTGAYLGVSVSDMDPEAAAYYGMPVGAYVHEAVPGYCAAAAGLQEKDIIIALGEYEVSNISELTRVLRKFKAGEKTTITIYRGGQEMVLPITLDAKPQTEQPSQMPEFPEDMPEGDFDEWYEYFAPYFGIG